MRILIKILKSIFFYPMMWLRGIMKLGFKLISVGFVIFGVVSLGYGGETFTKVDSVLFFVGGFVFFLVGMLYDQILLKLNPTSATLTLDI